MSTYAVVFRWLGKKILFAIAASMELLWRLDASAGSDGVAACSTDDVGYGEMLALTVLMVMDGKRITA